MISSESRVFPEFRENNSALPRVVVTHNVERKGAFNKSVECVLKSFHKRLSVLERSTNWRRTNNYEMQRATWRACRGVDIRNAKHMRRPHNGTLPKFACLNWSPHPVSKRMSTGELISPIFWWLVNEDEQICTCSDFPHRLPVCDSKYSKESWFTTGFRPVSYSVQACKISSSHIQPMSDLICTRNGLAV